MAVARGIRPQDTIAIDLGCGTGRNTLYLAEHGFRVYGMDIVPEMIAQLRGKAEAAGSGARVYGVCGNVCARWPTGDSILGIAIDTFCYKHVMDADERSAYRRELARTLKQGGLLLLTLASTEDGYYGLLPYRRLDTGMRVIRDPGNGIESVLYERSAIERSFADSFDVLHYAEKRKRGRMHGAEYDRATHVFVMQRR